MKRILLVIALAVITATFAPGHEMTHVSQDKKKSSEAESVADVAIFPPSEIKWTN